MWRGSTNDPRPSDRTDDVLDRFRPRRPPPDRVLDQAEPPQSTRPFSSRIQPGEMEPARKKSLLGTVVAVSIGALAVLLGAAAIGSMRNTARVGTLESAPIERAPLLDGTAESAMFAIQVRSQNLTTRCSTEAAVSGAACQGHCPEVICRIASAQRLLPSNFWMLSPSRSTPSRQRTLTKVTGLPARPLPRPNERMPHVLQKRWSILLLLN